MSYTQTPNYSLYKPTVNADNDQWGTHLNANADTLDSTLKTISNNAGVSMFNTRTGAVSLLNADVVTVLPASTTTPLMDSVAAVGTSGTWARADHVHPSDTSLATVSATNVGRNLLHNSMFRVAQRGIGPFTTLATFTLDRWFIAPSGGLDTVSVQQYGLNDSERTQIGDEAATLALLNTFTGNAGAAALNNLQQRIEDVRRLAGKTVTVSFWAKCASGALKIGINAFQGFGSGGSPSATVQALTVGNAITLSTTWTRYSTTFAIPSVAGKTTGTNNDHSTGLQIFFSSGATNNAIAGNIGVQSGAIALWGVQLEIGNVATPLEKPDPQQELAKCQRFYQIGSVQIQAYNVAGSGVVIMVPFAVAMRAGPVMVPSQVSNTNASSPTIAAADTNVYQVSALATATGGLNWRATFTASADL